MADRDTATLDDVEQVFRPSDLVTAAGTGHNGQLLVDTLAATMPAELETVLLQRENFELGRGRPGNRGPDGEGLRRKDWEDIAEFAGLKGVKLADVTVRGGADEDGNNVDSSQAWITFVYYDERGDTLKGAIPWAQYADEADEDDDRDPVLQSEALAKTPAARDHAAAQAKAREAEAAESQAAGGGGMPNLATAKASEIVAYLEEHPEQADAVIAFEKANKGSNARKSVVEFEPDESPSSSSSSGGSEGGEGGGEGGGGEPPSEPEPLSEAEAQRVAAIVEANDEAALVEEAKGRNLPHSGTKAELAERIVIDDRDKS